MSLIKSDVLIDITFPLFVSEINFSDHKEFVNSMELTNLDKIQKIIEFFGLEGEKIASVYEASNYLARKLLNNRNIKQGECFAKTKETFVKVFARWIEGVLNIWQVEVLGIGAFVNTVIVRSKNECTLKPVFLVPNGTKKIWGNFSIDNDNVVWEKANDGLFVKNPSLNNAIRRYLAEKNFGRGILSQIVKENQIYSLLESGLIFNGQEVCPKNTLPEEEYKYLVELAEASFAGWKSVSTGEGWDRSEKYNIHKDLTPCLCWE